MPLTAPTAERYSLLDLSEKLVSNVPTTYHYTNSSAPLDVSGIVYQPIPTMEFRLPAYAGSTVPREESAIVRMSDTVDIWRTMTNGRAHARIEARLREIAFDTDTQTSTSLLELWNGTVEIVQVNPDGEQGVVDVSVGPCGGRTTFDPTPVIADTCWKVFGDLKTCKFDNSALNLVPIETIVGTAVTIPAAATSIINQPPFYWQNGDVSRNDVRIKIRRWTSGNVFYLAQLPPLDWIPTAPLTISLRFRPGCRQVLQDCRTFGNEANFGGAGRKIPARNVLFELE